MRRRGVVAALVTSLLVPGCAGSSEPRSGTFPEPSPSSGEPSTPQLGETMVPSDDPEQALAAVIVDYETTRSALYRVTVRTERGNISTSGEYSTVDGAAELFIYGDPAFGVPPLTYRVVGRRAWVAAEPPDVTGQCWRELSLPELADRVSLVQQPGRRVLPAGAAAQLQGMAEDWDGDQVAGTSDLLHVASTFSPYAASRLGIPPKASIPVRVWFDVGGMKQGWRTTGPEIISAMQAADLPVPSSASLFFNESFELEVTLEPRTGPTWLEPPPAQQIVPVPPDASDKDWFRACRAQLGSGGNA